MENKVLNSGDRESYKKLYPWMTDLEINKMIAKRRKDQQEQAEFETQLEIAAQKQCEEAGLEPKSKDKSKSSTKEKDDMDEDDVSEPKMDNRAKHSSDSSKQPGTNGYKR